MSARGLNFLDKWMAENLPNEMTEDPVAVSDLADEMMKAASAQGISAGEIEEEVGSVCALIFKALLNRDCGDGPNEFDLLAARLAREANIPEKQAVDLIQRIGTDWESLLNEAHFLKELGGRLQLPPRGS